MSAENAAAALESVFHLTEMRPSSCVLFGSISWARWKRSAESVDRALSEITRILSSANNVPELLLKVQSEIWAPEPTLLGE